MGHTHGVQEHLLYPVGLLCIPRFVMLYAEQAPRAAGETWLAKHYILLGDVAKEFTPTAIGLAIILMLVIQAGGLVLSLYHMIANRWVTPVVEAHIAEGEARGQAENQIVWEAWNQRRLDAEAQDIPFDEPPPGSK